MRENGLRSKTVKKYEATTHSKHSYPVYPNLLNQQFHVDKPGAVWISDITYVWTMEGWLYLATVMDLFSRTMGKCFIMRLLNKIRVAVAQTRARDPAKKYE